jgi:hypothetical protein
MQVENNDELDSEVLSVEGITDYAAATMKASMACASTIKKAMAVA